MQTLIAYSWDSGSAAARAGAARVRAYYEGSGLDRSISHAGARLGLHLWESSRNPCR